MNIESFKLTRTTKEAVKTATAMTLTYGIALGAGWNKPMWGGFAVAMVSLSTLGLSLNKSALRLLGTLVAAVVALCLIGLFPQERWMFMVGLSLWVGVCAYMMQGSNRAYFWNVCGFVSVIICVSVVTTSASPFQVAILRAQETGLGILVYSLVAMLIWPRHSRDQFLDALTALNTSQSQLYERCCSALRTDRPLGQSEELRADIIRLQAGLDAQLEAAIADSYDIWESRRQWRGVLLQSARVSSALEQLAEGLTVPKGFSPEKLFPNLEVFTRGVAQQLAAAGQLLRGEKPPHYGAESALEADNSVLQTQPLYDVGSLALLRHQLVDLGTQAHALRAALEPGRQKKFPEGRQPVFTGFTLGWMPDTDRVATTLRIMLALWMAYLVYLYVDGLPGGPTFVMLTGSLTLALAGTPQLRPLRVVLPFTAVSVLMSLIYLLVMPRLTGFHELGLLIFAVTFGICQKFGSPAKQPVKMFLLALFVSFVAINNSQSYSFLSVTTLWMVFTLVFLLLAVVSYFPFSPRPEKVFQRQMRSFVHSCATLLSDLATFGQGGAQSPVDLSLRSWRIRYHCHALATLPARLANWSKLVESRYLPVDSSGQLQQLVSAADTLGFQIRNLVEASRQRGNKVQGEHTTVSDAWRASVSAALAEFAAALNRVEVHVSGDTTLDESRQAQQQTLAAALQAAAADSDMSVTPETEHILRIVGIAQGISQSLLALVRAARGIEWPRWNEERFY
ncbi:FUSC family protein [Microbulbifer hainanensis]|uniref:FUSC family protein n=1 Tax=Microbulbifer hainanensis TaxID=2735675 RepID=UPI001866BBFC|nr:FUSC family protein [Microbulbifer hainanensis]